MTRIFLLTLIALMAAMPLEAQNSYTPTQENLQSRKEFANARFGIFIHWGLYSMLGDGEWIMDNA